MKPPASSHGAFAVNVFLLPEEKTTAPTPASGTVHAVSSTVPDEKTIAALLEAAENAEQKRRVTVRFYAAICRFVVLPLMVVFLILLVMGLGPASSSFEPTLRKYVLDFLTVGNPLLILWVVRSYSRRQNVLFPRQIQTTVSALLHLSDEPRLLLPLVDTLNLPRTVEWKTETFPVLTERLWNLPAADAALSLDDTRRAALRNRLAYAYEIRAAIKREANAPDYFDDMTTDLAVALMKTLAGLGDKKSVKVLEKIIKAEAVTPNETVVRDAAREYLPILVQTIAQKGTLQTKILQCLGGSSAHDGQQMLSDYLDTFAPEDAKAALVELLHVRRTHQVTLTNVIRGVSLPFALFCLCGSAVHGNVQAFLGIVALFFQFNFVGPMMLTQHRSSDNGKLIYELAKRSENDTRLIPLLLTALPVFMEPKQVDAVRKTLARLLPLLRPGDAALVPPDARACLRWWLKRPRLKMFADTEAQTLTVAALDALAALGDTKSLPDAENLVFQTQVGVYSKTKLHEAAVRCVEALRAQKG